jgi:hypothetical protein
MFIIHIIGGVYSLFYPYFQYIFAFKSRFFDFLYLFVEFGTQFSWTLFKGECIANVLQKRALNPNYKIGSDIYSGDVKDFVPSSLLRNYVMPVIKMIGISLLMTRRQFHWISQLFVIGTFLSYSNVINYDWSHSVYFYLYIGCLLLIVTKWIS